MTRRESKRSKPAQRRDLLSRHWVHSHNTSTEAIFRPSDYSLPPSRGPRRALELLPDGTFVETATSPTDRPEDRPKPTRGTWKLEGEDTLVLSKRGASTPTRILRVASVEKDRLVIKK